MGPSDPCFEPIYHYDMIYEDWINSSFTLVHKSILIIIQDCTKDSEQCFFIGLID